MIYSREAARMSTAPTMTQHADPHEVWGAYEDRLIRTKASKTALRELRLTRDAFFAYLEEQDLALEDVRNAHLEEFFSQVGWAPSTQRARITYLRAPWQYAINELGVLTRDPFKTKVKMEQMPVREIKVIPNAELRAIKRELRTDEQWALFHVLAYTGMRRSEIRGLKWTDISFAEQSMTFIGKGNRERTIPLHPELQKALNRLGTFRKGSAYVFPGQGGGHLSQNGMYMKMVRMLHGRPYSAHDFRRTVSTSLEINNAREAAIKQILWGPSGASGNIRLEHYTRLSKRALFDEILKLYADDPI